MSKYRITSAQESYLTRLLNEAFANHYSPKAFVAPNQLHTMSAASASIYIDELKAAKTRGWTAWETTPEGLAEKAAQETRTVEVHARVAVIRELKAQGLVCNCSEQTLETDEPDWAKCPLHAEYSKRTGRTYK